MRIILPRFAPIPLRKDTPKGKEIGIRPESISVTKAIDIMQENHPLHQVFVKWAKTPTKRKAREFCRTMRIVRAA